MNGLNWSETVKIAHWGMKMDECCQLHDITKASYYWRLRKVREAFVATTDTSPDFVEVPPATLQSENIIPECKTIAMIRGRNHTIMETNCEGCARICRAMNLQISGDSVIRLLTKRYRLQPVSECGKCGNAIGVDDFAFKKRHTYGTIIVVQSTHRLVTILDGCDRMTLKEWLKNNKHVKTVTRDRASAYSSAIQEILPDAMQIADQFHLHQNLLEAVKNTVNSVIPVDVRIPIDYETSKTAATAREPCKKNVL